MLFNVSCKTGKLQVDDKTVQVVSFGRVIWSTLRRDITYIGVKKGKVMADITVYTARNHYPAQLLTKQEADQFVTFFPGIPYGIPMPPVAQPPASIPSIAPNSQPYNAPTVPFQVPPPPAKKNPPRWAYIATGVIALVLCTCISTAVIAAVTSNKNPQTQVVSTPTSTTESSTLAATTIGTYTGTHISTYSGPNCQANFTADTETCSDASTHPKANTAARMSGSQRESLVL